jgi:hypothetical protein
MRKVQGTENLRGTQVLGPWHPRDKIQNIGSLRHEPNPFNSNDPNEDVLGPGGVGGLALPFRPPPIFDASDASAPRGVAQGIYYPTAGLRRAMGDFDSIDQNFSQSDLSWNRGASQDDEKELKELYFDIEMFDARLWMRLGKQSIVWGKTELFRTTDQFNPQDLALASLPSLEESRISLWAARFVYSLYEVGPLSDVRFELAFNYDEMEPADLGRCGEPYTVNAACNLTFGLFAHGLTGLALAGIDRPPDPWESSEGWEIGGRMEFRWDRFSFALMDFYGYHDLPYQSRIFNYSRNVDPTTGRPRVAGASGRCESDVDSDGIGDDPDCLAPGQTGDRNALEFHHANQQVFAMICASSVGFSDLDRTACGQSVFSSQASASPATDPLTVAGAVAMILAGGSNVGPGSPQDGGYILFELIDLPTWTQVMTDQILPLLNRDPADPTPPPPGHPFPTNTLSRRITDEQEALLGCGPFYGTHCDTEGVDLLNAEASVLMQSFPSVVGTPQQGFRTDSGLAQPGTEGFRIVPGGTFNTPVATRYDPATGGVVMIPGSRGPWDPAYDPRVDGCVGSSTALGVSFPNASDCDTARRLIHPIAFLENGQTQTFRSELSALSWNLLVALVALSGDPADPDENDNIASWDGQPLISQGGNPSVGTNVYLPPGDPGADGIPGTSDDGAKCSLVTPQFCDNVLSFYNISGIRRNDVRAAGNGRYGRRDFTWHGGGQALLRYEKRNVLGFSMDFAEDTTATNWSLEATRVDGIPIDDHDSEIGVRKIDQYNLTISVDRPTWITFLNETRTFFFNSQWFFQYVNGYRRSMTSNGPYNVLMTLTAETGYFQDRLRPRMTTVYDFESNSGAGLPSIEYRYTANFKVTFGVALFWGRWQTKTAPLAPIALHNQVGRGAYESAAENALAVVRDRDEVFLRITYTF